MKLASFLLGASLALLPRVALAEPPARPPPDDGLVQKLEERDAKRDAVYDEEAKAAQAERKAAFDKARGELAQHRQEDAATVIAVDQEVRSVRARSLRKFALGAAVTGGGLVVLGVVLYAPGLVARSQLEGGLATSAEQQSAATRMSTFGSLGGLFTGLGIVALAGGAGFAIASAVISPRKDAPRAPATGVRFEGGTLVW